MKAGADPFQKNKFQQNCYDLGLSDILQALRNEESVLEADMLKEIASRREEFVLRNEFKQTRASENEEEGEDDDIPGKSGSTTTASRTLKSHVIAPRAEAAAATPPKVSCELESLRRCLCVRCQERNHEKVSDILPPSAGLQPQPASYLVISHGQTVLTRIR